jgi:hypothetical protein
MLSAAKCSLSPVADVLCVGVGRKEGGLIFLE